MGRGVFWNKSVKGSVVTGYCSTAVILYVLNFGICSVTYFNRGFLARVICLDKALRHSLVLPGGRRGGRAPPLPFSAAGWRLPSRWPAGHPRGASSPSRRHAPVPPVSDRSRQPLYAVPTTRPGPRRRLRGVAGSGRQRRMLTLRGRAEVKRERRSGWQCRPACKQPLSCRGRTRNRGQRGGGSARRRRAVGRRKGSKIRSKREGPGGC